MPINGILTFISMINTSSQKLKAFQHFGLYEQIKRYFHLCPSMDFLQTLHINNSLYTNYENEFIELDS